MRCALSSPRSPEASTAVWLRLWADLGRYPGRLPRRLRLAIGSQGFWAVTVYRLGQGVYALPPPLATLAKLLWKPLALATEIATGIELPPSCVIGPGFNIGHFGGIVLNGATVLGARCNLSHGVTIGAGWQDGVYGVPVVGDRVYIGPGAKLFGPIRVGSDSAIGANAVVNRDVPPGVSVAGVPARPVSSKGSRGLIELGSESGPEEVQAA